jgi:hypothetical protein
MEKLKIKINKIKPTKLQKWQTIRLYLPCQIKDRIWSTSIRKVLKLEYPE